MEKVQKEQKSLHNMKNDWMGEGKNGIIDCLVFVAKKCQGN